MGKTADVQDSIGFFTRNKPRRIDRRIKDLTVDPEFPIDKSFSKSRIDNKFVEAAFYEVDGGFAPDAGKGELKMNQGFLEKLAGRVPSLTQKTRSYLAVQ